MTLNLDLRVIVDALDVLCAQLTRDLFAIAKFFVNFGVGGNLRFSEQSLDIYE